MKIKQYKLQNKRGLSASILNYGLILQELIITLENHAPDHLVLGFENPESYRHPTYLLHYPYLGAVIGRWANRVKNSTFQWQNKQYNLIPNQGPHQLHGGPNSFDKRFWEIQDYDPNNYIIATLTSPDGDNGYPGTLHINALISIDDSNTLKIKFECTSDEPLPVNLTWHPYFNFNHRLKNILDHSLMLNSDFYLDKDENMIITGKIVSAQDGNVHCNQFRKLDSLIYSEGLDHSFIIKHATNKPLQLAGKLANNTHSKVMEVWTNNPIVHIYTGQHMKSFSVPGEKPLNPWYGICFECQAYTDQLNNPHFPPSICYPNLTFVQETIYQFHFNP